MMGPEVTDVEIRTWFNAFPSKAFPKPTRQTPYVPHNRHTKPYIAELVYLDHPSSLTLLQASFAAHVNILKGNISQVVVVP